jgi:hypothetical protein
MAKTRATIQITLERATERAKATYLRAQDAAGWALARAQERRDDDAEALAQERQRRFTDIADLAKGRRPAATRFLEMAETLPNLGKGRSWLRAEARAEKSRLAYEQALDQHQAARQAALARFLEAQDRAEASWRAALDRLASAAPRRTGSR